MAIFFFLIMFVINILTGTKVRCADQCRTHSDCTRSGYFRWYCCGGYLSFGSKDRSCTFSSCLGRYCSTDNDCGDLSMCCRSNRCVNKGCSGCTKNIDCYRSHVCCKNTFPLHQTVCASSCVNLTCNSNNDCAGWGECCRGGKCTQTGCSNLCKSNSECDLGQYCCLREGHYRYWPYDGCSADCLGKICITNDDCGGRNACCISNKCVDRGCSGCSSNADCSSGQYCCKERHWYTVGKCSADCVGKSCTTSENCGGPFEICNANYKCEISVKMASCTSSSLPPWQIAVVTINLVVFVMFIAAFVAVVWYARRKRRLNSSPASNSVPPQNNAYGAQNREPNVPVENFHNLVPQNSNVSNPVYQPHIPTGHAQRFYEVPSSPNQDPPIQNPQQRGNRIDGFDINPSNYDDHVADLPSEFSHEIVQASSQHEENDNSCRPQKPPPYNPQYESK